MESLIQGYRRFREQYYERERSLYTSLVREGQKPKALVVACSDSRVDPSILTQSAPGDIFVIRNVANLVPPYQPDPSSYHGTSAALEFGVCGLGIPNIIVLGHQYCAGVRSLVEREYGSRGGPYSFVNHWMEIAERVKTKVRAEGDKRTVDDICHCCEKEAIVQSLENLMTFPWIKERVAAGTLTLNGWYFDMEAGELQAYDGKKGLFFPL